MTRRVSPQHGAVTLILVLSLLAILLLLGATATTITTTDLKIAENYKTRTQAFYIAEAGLNRAISSLNTIPDWLSTVEQPTINAFPPNETPPNRLENGTYVVQVFVDDPSRGKVRIVSTSTVDRSSSTAAVEAVLYNRTYPILDYATFTCGDLVPNSGKNNTISGGKIHIGGSLVLEGPGKQQFQSNGHVAARGSVELHNRSQILDADVDTNGGLLLNGTTLPNIRGKVRAKGGITNPTRVSGTVQGNLGYDVVEDLCSGTKLATLAVTTEEIAKLLSKATQSGTTINGNLSLEGGRFSYTGVVRVSGNMSLAGNISFSNNILFIVDGSLDLNLASITGPAGKSVSFILPRNHVQVRGNGTSTVQGALHIGSVDGDGSDISRGTVTVHNKAHLVVEGSLAVLGTLSLSNGQLTVNYTRTSDENLGGNAYLLERWRELRG